MPTARSKKIKPGYYFIILRPLNDDTDIDVTGTVAIWTGVTYLIPGNYQPVPPADVVYRSPMLRLDVLCPPDIQKKYNLQHLAIGDDGGTPEMLSLQELSEIVFAYWHRTDVDSWGSEKPKCEAVVKNLLYQLGIPVPK
jgi:hypothetical protein